jgi:hypothetical protein
LGRPVGGAVIDEDDFKLFRALKGGPDTLVDPSDVFLLVVSGEYYAYETTRRLVL